MSSIDDGSIPDDANLLRRIHPDQVILDANLGKPRPSSAAFKDPEMSVDAEPLLLAQGLSWEFSLRGHAGYSLVRFQAQVARDKGLAVCHKPLAENKAHAEVVGKKTQSVARHLAACSEWVWLEAIAEGA